MDAHQRGQALPLGLAMILLGVLGALVLYNTGRTATDKARLANAADAAAYSGLLWQARALNFQAYTNRAMVANEVSIAQAVSLNSWTDYGERTSTNIAAVLAGLPLANVISAGVNRALTAVNQVVTPVTGAMVSVIDTVNEGLTLSQQAMFASAFAATPEIVDDVIGKSDPRFESATAYSVGGLYANLADWSDFTERHDADSDAMVGRAQLVMDSRDDFSAARDWKFFHDFWFYSTPIMRHRVFRSGSTRLMAFDGPEGRRWEWKAKDTIALQNRRLKWTGREKKSELPIGWGEAYANADGGTSHLTELCLRTRNRGHPQCGTWGKNRGAEKLAALEATPMGGYDGLRAFRTISAAMLEREDGDPTLRLKIEAALPVDAARSSADSVGGETFGLDVDAAGGRLSSISIAEVYYRRPDELAAGGSRRTREAANGYNPYWDVRLAPIPDSERLLALALRGGETGRAPESGASVAPPRDGAVLDAGALDGDGGGGGGGDAGATGYADAAGALPTYVASLAAVYGGADGAVVGELERLRALSRADLDGFVDGTDPAAIVRERLEDVLEDAKDDILAGLTDAAIGRARGALESLGAPDIETEIAEARELSERLESVADVVSRDLGDYLETLVETTVARIAPEVGRIEEVARALETASDETVTALQEELDGLVATRDEILDGLREEIVTELLAVVERHVPEWTMPLAVAHETVDALLAEFRGQLGTEGLDGVPWVFVDDEEGIPGENDDD